MEETTPDSRHGTDRACSAHSSRPSLLPVFHLTFAWYGRSPPQKGCRLPVKRGLQEVSYVQWRGACGVPTKTPPHRPAKQTAMSRPSAFT